MVYLDENRFGETGSVQTADPNQAEARKETDLSQILCS